LRSKVTTNRLQLRASPSSSSKIRRTSAPFGQPTGRRWHGRTLPPPLLLHMLLPWPPLQAPLHRGRHLHLLMWLSRLHLLLRQLLR
jgi:hypothetical protein